MIAVVAYTGKETKFHFNQGKNTYKVSKTEKQLNIVYCYQILLTVLLSFGMTQFGSGIDEELTDFWNYLDESFVQFWRFFVLLARLVPLEVLLIVEISKIAYQNFIEWDVEMIATEKSPAALKYCTVLSKHLIEELSEVHHVLFDKTGTLTKNELKFRAIVFNGTVCRSDNIFDLLNEIYANNSKEAELLFKCFTVCNDVSMIQREGEDLKVEGVSQDELLLVSVLNKSLFFSLVLRDRLSVGLQDNQDK